MRLGNDRPEESTSKSHGSQRERGGKLCIGRMLVSRLIGEGNGRHREWRDACVY